MASAKSDSVRSSLFGRLIGAVSGRRPLSSFAVVHQEADLEVARFKLDDASFFLAWPIGPDTAFL